MEEKIIYNQIGKDPLYKIWHASGEHLLMYIHSGSGSIVCGEKIFTFGKGTLVFIAANTYHYTVPDDPEIYNRSKLLISPQKFTDIIKLIDNDTFSAFDSKAIVYASVPERDRTSVEAIFNEIDLCNTYDERQMIMLSSCMKLLFYLNRYSVESTSSATDFMIKAIEYINQNIAEDLTVNSICNHINLSKYHFCRQFKKNMGLTVMKYILRTRITLAKSDLAKTDLSISEISEKCGFSSVSYFCRIFKETENCSPLQFRKNCL